MRFPLPPGAVPLTVMTQDRELCVWFEVDINSKEREMRTLHSVGTGHHVPPGATYVGTAHNVYDLGLVIHIYERHDG